MEYKYLKYKNKYLKLLGGVNHQSETTINNSGYYSGYKKDGKKDGFGKMTYYIPNNNNIKYYIGYWKDDTRVKGLNIYKNGHIKLIFNNEETEYYIGTIKNENNYTIYKDGTIQKLVNGNVEEHNILELITKNFFGIINPQNIIGTTFTRKDNGIMKYQNGAVYIGLFEDDKRFSNSLYFYSDKKFYYGEWKDDNLINNRHLFIYNEPFLYYNFIMYNITLERITDFDNKSIKNKNESILSYKNTLIEKINQGEFSKISNFKLDLVDKKKSTCYNYILSLPKGCLDTFFTSDIKIINPPN
jgi:hypothetical protein